MWSCGRRRVTDSRSPEQILHQWNHAGGLAPNAGILTVYSEQSRCVAAHKLLLQGIVKLPAALDASRLTAVYSPRS